MATAALANAPVIAPQFRALILSSEGHLAADLGDLEAAERQIEEAIGLALEVKDMPVLARVGVAAAMLWACRGDAVRAAETLGATEQLRGASDRFNPDIVRLVERLRGELGDASYEAAYTGGRDLDRAGALARIRSTTARTGDPASDQAGDHVTDGPGE